MHNIAKNVKNVHVPVNDRNKYIKAYKQRSVLNSWQRNIMDRDIFYEQICPSVIASVRK